ncbi:sensor histidine kinase [Nocardia sp. BSTN01]|uniref:sensor histidine kinase n=1 Tax=Nocardia sp. BSTN01 TaxID=2783665 RepID=UPI00188FD302|nr:sensor histidine kinase [Nocardia sp. BSTN01]MBF4999607.1 sensor histidine kinase [Nocardia sp. BSTN01]
MTTSSTEPRPGEFVHPAVFYHSDADYLDALAPFITEGLAQQHPVAVAVPAPRLRVLREAVGAAGDRVRWIDMAEAGRNPGRIIPGVLRRFADAHPDRHVRIIGEPIWPGRTATEYPACAQHEALINAAFAGRDVTIVCPYDATRLGADALADARLTHPLLWEPHRRYRSERYDPDSVVSRYNQALTVPTATAEHHMTTTTEISAARRVATAEVRRLGLAEERVADFELIVTELITNSLVHTAGPCRWRLWREDDDIVFDLRDSGHVTDPLIGRRPPDRDRFGGRGLFLVNELADLVRIHLSAEGTTWRVLLHVDSR